MGNITTHMWYRKTLHINTVSVVITPTTIACVWIEQSTLKPSVLRCNALNVQSLRQYTWHNGLLYNPTEIQTILKKFIAKHSIKNPFVAIALIDQSISANCITSSAHNFTHAVDTHLLLSHTQYLYPADTDHFVFYVQTIARTTLLQYTLMALGAKLHITVITTPTIALIELYKLLHSDKFRQAQFARDMQECQNNLVAYFTRARLETIVEKIPNCTQEELFFIAVGAGLSLVE